MLHVLAITLDMSWLLNDSWRRYLADEIQWARWALSYEIL